MSGFPMLLRRRIRGIGKEERRVRWGGAEIFQESFPESSLVSHPISAAQLVSKKWKTF